MDRPQTYLIHVYSLIFFSLNNCMTATSNSIVYLIRGAHLVMGWLEALFAIMLTIMAFTLHVRRSLLKGCILMI